MVSAFRRHLSDLGLEGAFRVHSRVQRLSVPLKTSEGCLSRAIAGAKDLTRSARRAASSSLQETENLRPFGKSDQHTVSLGKRPREQAPRAAGYSLHIALSLSLLSKSVQTKEIDEKLFKRCATINQSVAAIALQWLYYGGCRLCDDQAENVLRNASIGQMKSR